MLCKESTEQGTNNPPSNPPPSSDTLKYQLVWSDEFDGSSIDAGTWNFETGGSGWGNHEQEYYQEANAAIENGNLVITGKKETVGSNKYTSARMTTLGKKEFLYGRIEARIKIPVGKGFWPAFWMMGSNIKTADWPACGETDIMEHINDDSLMYGTIHWDNNGHASIGGKTTSTPSDYHVYGVEWDASSIKWSIDSVVFYEASLKGNSMDEFHQPFFILLNFALGGDWPGQTIDDSLLPAKMYVDYVRVYQKK
ncbi:MAG TPA: glycoside hydrolase family 16 protein [Parafilimonas sp.]|nr:glycoside hydrolase family 16 protein [Parafilimonas sp.]